MDKDKLISSTSGQKGFIADGVTKSGGNMSGPTGSQRDYGKTGATGKAPNMDAGKFNPMNYPAKDAEFAVGGV